MIFFLSKIQSNIEILENDKRLFIFSESFRFYIIRIFE